MTDSARSIESAAFEVWRCRVGYAKERYGQHHRKELIGKRQMVLMHTGRLTAPWGLMPEGNYLLGRIEARC